MKFSERTVATWWNFKINDRAFVVKLGSLTALPNAGVTSMPCQPYSLTSNNNNKSPWP
jgi:hypothetical protein